MAFHTFSKGNRSITRWPEASLHANRLPSLKRYRPADGLAMLSGSWAENNITKGGRASSPARTPRFPREKIMKIGSYTLLAVTLVCAFSMPALPQRSGTVDPAEVKRIIAEHPDYAVWLSDPALAKLTLAGPQMPGSQFNVDDIRRPQPRHVNTGTACSSKPPSDADILFDGHDLSKWTGDHFGEWTLHDGILTTGGRVYNFLKTKESYGDAQIHVEFKEPEQPNPPANPQYHGNSGVFLMGLYEVQILDNYKTDTYPDGMVEASTLSLRLW